MYRRLAMVVSLLLVLLVLGACAAPPSPPPTPTPTPAPPAPAVGPEKLEEVRYDIEQEITLKNEGPGMQKAAAERLDTLLPKAEEIANVGKMVAKGSRVSVGRTGLEPVTP